MVSKDAKAIAELLRETAARESNTVKESIFDNIIYHRICWGFAWKFYPASTADRITFINCCGLSEKDV